MTTAGEPGPGTAPAPSIYVDADGCPVKDEVYRVAQRYRLQVTVVANARLQVPDESWIRPVVVGGRFDAADDWIVEQVTAGDIVVTADILLAARCLEKGSRVIEPRGRPFSAESIGDAVASRALQAHLRELGARTAGPAPFEKGDRSRFLQALDQAVQAAQRQRR